MKIILGVIIGLLLFLIFTHKESFIPIKTLQSFGAGVAPEIELRTTISESTNLRFYKSIKIYKLP